MPMNNPAAYSDDDIAAILEGMGDLSSAEQEMQRQNQLSMMLRGNALQPSARRDWASQLAKAIHGGMAGASFGRERSANEAYRGAKSDANQRMMRILMRRGQTPAAATPPIVPQTPTPEPASPFDPSVLGGGDQFYG